MTTEVVLDLPFQRLADEVQAATYQGSLTNQRTLLRLHGLASLSVTGHVQVIREGGV